MLTFWRVHEKVVETKAGFADPRAGFQKFRVELQISGQTVDTLDGLWKIWDEQKKQERKKKKTLLLLKSSEKTACATFTPNRPYLLTY